MNSRSASALNLGSPPCSTDASHEWQQPDTIPQIGVSNPTLRLTRSAESFSPPVVSPRDHRHSRSIVAPPRFSSLLPLAPVHDGLETKDGKGESNTLQPSRSKRESGVWDLFALGTAISPGQLPGIQEDSSYFGHALTTPDDSAIHAITPPFSPILEDVDEEPEKFISPRPAPLPPLRTPTSPKSPHFDFFSFSNQRSPLAKPRARANSHISPKCLIQGTSITRPMSQMSETLASASLARRGSIHRPTANRRKSNTWRVIEESWEDDVDYIYENALEADCDFEWDRASCDEPYDNRQSQAEQAVRINPHCTLKQRVQTRPSTSESNGISPNPFSSGDFRTSLLVPRSSNLSDLVPASVISTSITEMRLTTSADSYDHTRFNVDEGFSISPSLLVPQEYKDTQEVTYEDLIEEYDGSDRHFPMLDASRSATNSTRSSRIRSSRRSSYDSSLVSSALSSGLWTSSIRRSASSAGSVPELVPSRRSRKELSFSLVDDQLSEQIASLRSFGEEKDDEDVTPPGRIVEGLAFFTAENESQGLDWHQNHIQPELKNSLELAQRDSQCSNRSLIKVDKRGSSDLNNQGSQSSTRARHHKQALSESAAKLFATTSKNVDDRPTKSRNRSNTTAHARQPVLRLFPSPPQHTPTPTNIELL